MKINDTLKTSIIEDLLYSEIDNDTSKLIKYFQNEQLNKIQFTIDRTSQFLFFLISLLWRIPKTDFAFNDLMARSEITTNGTDSEVLRRNLAYNKVQRACIFQHHVDEIIKRGKKGQVYINIHQFNRDIFVIGDYPILFRRTPHFFSEFNDIDFLIAVSSRRIYSSRSDKFESFKEINALKYNAAMINQSVRYVGCSNKLLLEGSVKFYHEMIKKGLIYNIDEQIFQT